MRIFEKPGETKILTDGTVSEISFCPAGVQRVLSAGGTRLAPTEAERRPEPFVQGMQRGAECRWHSFSTDRSEAETGSSMLGLRGAERQWRSFSTDRSEAETSPLSGQG